MRMQPYVVASIIAVGVILLLLQLGGGLRGTPAPTVPKDVFHNSVISDAACRTCHTPGKQAPLRKEHAPVTECMTCHGKRKNRR
jgi:hypothetical protein